MSRDSHRAWRMKNPDKVRAYQKEWREKNRKRVREYARKYEASHPRTRRFSPSTPEQRARWAEQGRARYWGPALDVADLVREAKSVLKEVGFRPVRVRLRASAQPRLTGSCTQCGEDVFSPRRVYCAPLCSRRARHAKERQTPGYRARKQGSDRRRRQTDEYREKNNLRNARRRERKAEYLERQRAYQREWRARNRNRLRAASKRYRETHSDEIEERQRSWRAAHPEAVKEYQRRADAKRRDK